MSLTKAILIFSLQLFMSIFNAQLKAEDKITTESLPSNEESSIKTRLIQTRDLLIQGREDDAENRVEQDARSTPQTADWYQEKAATYLNIAVSAQVSGDFKTLKQAVRRTLAELDKAEDLAKDDSATLAGIAELRGFIRERLLGTTTEAVEHYKKAAALKPDSTSARQKLRQLDSAADSAPAVSAIPTAQ
jgi:tetratricopeptide (TPR) repeat protein